MTFPYVLIWDADLRRQADLARRRNTFGGYVWPGPPRAIGLWRGQEMRDEVLWLLEGGWSPEMICAELRVNAKSVAKGFARNGRQDIANRFDVKKVAA